MNSGEQVANLTGHGGWILTLDWSNTGEYLLSGYVRSLSEQVSEAVCMLRMIRSYDSKAKIWRIETRSCVATHSYGNKPLWSAKWLPKNTTSEMFALGGGSNAISFYREAAG